MIAAWRTARGVLRSMRIYYGGRERATAMDDFYRAFVRDGDLAFDIGAHVGDRVACFRRLGARVVALEPQPALARALSMLFALDRNVVIEQAAIASAPGSVELMINVDNPTVSTASADFIRAADGAAGWREQRWTRSVRVHATTLDALIARHGRPAFIKIDVEGFEAEALAGLTQAGRGAVVRIHHHPARRCAGRRRPLRGARLRALQCSARRKPELRARRVEFGRRLEAMAARAAA